MLHAGILRSVWRLAVFYLVVFLGAEALHQEPLQQQQHHNQTLSESTTDESPAQQPESLSNTTEHGSEAPAAVSESHNPAVVGTDEAASEPPVVQDGRWYPQPANPPQSDGDQILRNIRAMHDMGIPLLSDNNLMQRLGIRRAEGTDNPDRGDGSNVEANEGSGRPAASEAPSPSQASPLAAHPTLTSVTGLGAVERGSYIDPALCIYHGRSL